MPEVDLKITTFLRSLAAVSTSQYEVWDAKGKMLFATARQEIDFLTTASHLKMAKGVILSKSFNYTGVADNQYLCGLPLPMPHSDHGAIIAAGPLPDNTDASDHPSLMKILLGQIVSLARKNGTDEAQNSPLPESVDHDFEDLYLFANISRQFRSLRFRQPVLGKLMHRMAESLRADAAFLQLDEMPHYNRLEIHSDLLQQNDNPSDLEDRLQRLVTGSIAKCSGHYHLVNDSRDEPAFDSLSDRPFRFLGTAIRHMKTIYGWMGLLSYQVDRDFKPHEMDIVQTLANQLAVMIANMEQHDDLEKFTVNIVCSLVNAIETKDSFVQGHSKRVHLYAMQMARNLKLREEELEALKWAAALHDIGKIGIPERILCKPGKLTEKEFGLIKQHPTKGRSILEPIRQLAPSLGAIAHHHERFDGKGYPEGLRGEDIPLLARILTVADTFDALTSARSYHQAKSPMEALLVLEQVAGTQLDPHLVKVFKNVLRKERFRGRPN